MYPPIEYPVSRGTPSISPLIKWDHSEDHYVTKSDTKRLNKFEWRKVYINIADPSYEYLEGHQIEYKTIFPASGYIFLVWETFALMHHAKYTEFSVIFENVEFLSAIFLEKDIVTELVVCIDPKTGKFELINGTNVAARGHISHVDHPELLQPHLNEISKLPTLFTEDFYRVARLCGHHHHGAFERIVEIKIDRSSGKLKWDSNWIAFLDGVFQIFPLDYGTKYYGVAKSIDKIIIDPTVAIGSDVEVLKLGMDCALI